MKTKKNETLNKENQQELDGHDELFAGPMAIFQPIPLNIVFTGQDYDEVLSQNDNKTPNQFLLKIHSFRTSD